MNRFLQLVGWRRDRDSGNVALFQTWHSYALLAVALIIGVSLFKVL